MQPCRWAGGLLTAERAPEKTERPRRSTFFSVASFRSSLPDAWGVWALQPHKSGLRDSTSGVRPHVVALADAGMRVPSLFGGVIWLAAVESVAASWQPDPSHRSRGAPFHPSQTFPRLLKIQRVHRDLSTAQSAHTPVCTAHAPHCSDREGLKAPMAKKLRQLPR